MLAQQNPFDLFGDSHLQTELELPTAPAANEPAGFDDLDDLFFDELEVLPQAHGEIEPGIYFDLSNAEYHGGPGISKSGLDWIEHNPSQLIWSQNAPRDHDKEKALDFGTVKGAKYAPA